MPEFVDITAENLGLSAWYLIGSIAIVVATYGFTAWLTSLQSRLRGRTPALTRLVAWMPVVQIGIWFAALALGAWALSEAPNAVVLAFAVPLALAAVLGSRDLARDAIAGAVLAFEHTILAGDIVHVWAPLGELTGRITSIGVRRTTLETNDGEEVFVPNRTMLNSVVRTNREHELDSPVEISMPGSALERAPIGELRKAALEAAHCSRFASLKRAPEFFVETDDAGQERAALVAYAFSPELVRHLETDVLELLQAELTESVD